MLGNVDGMRLCTGGRNFKIFAPPRWRLDRWLWWFWALRVAPITARLIGRPRPTPACGVVQLRAAGEVVQLRVVDEGASVLARVPSPRARFFH